MDANEEGMVPTFGRCWRGRGFCVGENLLFYFHRKKKGVVHNRTPFHGKEKTGCAQSNFFSVQECKAKQMAPPSFFLIISVVVATLVACVVSQGIGELTF